MNYYEEIKHELIENEAYKKVKDYNKNKHDLESYYTVGKLLIEAQGGEKRAKYGNGLIKEYSEKLINEVGKKYSTTLLKRMRQFYLIIQKGALMAHQLSISHYQELLPIDNINIINYYINECIKNHLTRKELRERIKSKEYERLDDRTKEKLTENNETSISDFIKSPIIIKSSRKEEIITEKVLKNLIIENIEDFMKELGNGYAYIGNEFKIKIGNNYNYIDLLLFNYMYNSFVVVELKITELKKEYLGQIEVYMNYIDKNIKNNNHDKTIGLIICKKDNHFILAYSSDSRIIVREYSLI